MKCTGLYAPFLDDDLHGERSVYLAFDQFVEYNQEILVLLRGILDVLETI
jgi:hypothetical protein